MKQQTDNNVSSDQLGTLSNDRYVWKKGKKNMSVKHIDFASVCDFSIGFWNCSDSVVFFVFILLSNRLSKPC